MSWTPQMGWCYPLIIPTGGLHSFTSLAWFIQGFTKGGQLNLEFVKSGPVLHSDFWREHGSSNNQSTCYLWTWRKHLSVYLWESYYEVSFLLYTGCSFPSVKNLTITSYFKWRFESESIALFHQFRSSP